MTTLTPNSFSDITWNDISIQKINDHDILIVLICHNDYEAKELYSIIKNYPYDMKLFFNKKQECKIQLDFIDTDFTLDLQTNRSEDWYYPIGWLRTGLVNYITTGNWIGDTSNTNMNKNFIPLIRPTAFLN